MLAWYELCCRWFMRLPGSSLLCGRPELWQIVVYYMTLGVLFYVLLKSTVTKERLLLKSAEFCTENGK